MTPISYILTPISYNTLITKRIREHKKYSIK